MFAILLFPEMPDHGRDHVLLCTLLIMQFFLLFVPIRGHLLHFNTSTLALGHNVSKVMNLIGDVKGKVGVMVDDMIHTVGTITNAVAVVHQEGGKAVYACCTHLN